MSTAIKVENLSKAYQLGTIGTGTLSRDLERWIARVRGKEDPFLTIGEANDRSVKGSSDVVLSLNNISFDIQQGDAVGIIGRNGAGKSTLLKLLSRVTSPTSGSIKVKGRIASLLEVGTGFHPELTGRENIFLNGAILGMRKKEIARKFDQIVDFSGVERYIDTPVKRYSSGMYVRLAFAVAAHLESEILIVDEVLAVGDAEFQKKCLGKMGDVSKGEGRTVLFVSHNMASIKSLCRTTVILKNGTLQFNGSAEEGISLYNDSIMKNKESQYHDLSERKTKVKDIFLSNAKGNVLDFIYDLDTKVYLNFILNIENNYGVNLGFTIFNSEIIPLFSSPVYDTFTSKIEQHIKIKIPIDLLKAGEYFVEGALWGPDGTIEQKDSYLTFKIENRNKMEIIGAGVKGVVLNPYGWEKAL